MSTQSINTNRFPFIDALRGLAIIIVVFGHVETYAFFNFEGNTILGNLFKSIQMPLFFFISGFVTYKANFQCKDINSFFILIYKKVLHLILPALTLGLIYTYLKSDSTFIDFISDAAKKGYWFTFALFEMFLVYYFIVYIMGKFKKDGLWVLFFISVLAFILKLPFKVSPTLDLIGNYTSLHFTLSHFQFFAVGLLVRKNLDFFEKLLDSKSISFIVMIIFSVCYYVLLQVYYSKGRVDILWKVIETLSETVISYPALYILYNIFRRLSQTTNIFRLVEFIGKRTLDIYLLHYFFLPKLPMIGDFFRTIEPSTIVLECIITIPIALVIIGISLVVSEIIKVSPVLSRFILGSKISSTK